MPNRILENAGYVVSVFAILYILISIFVNPQIYLLLSKTYSVKDGSNPILLNFLRLFSIIIGALLLVIGTLLIALSRQYSNQQYPYLVLGLSLWFVIDSVASLLLNYQYNALLNLLFVLPIGYMLIRLRPLPQQVSP